MINCDIESSPIPKTYPTPPSEPNKGEDVAEEGYIERAEWFSCTLSESSTRGRGRSMSKKAMRIDVRDIIEYRDILAPCMWLTVLYGVGY